MADMLLLPRPYWDHPQIVWEAHEGHDRSTYFKMDMLQLREDGFNDEVASWWSAQSGKDRQQ